MFRKNLIVALIGVCAILLLGQSSVHACSCGQWPTLLDEIEGSDLVVVTRLAAVEKVREKERRFDDGYSRSVTMVVEKVYKGDVKPGDELKFAQGSRADCIWGYSEELVGEKYLFYVDKPTNGDPISGQDPKKVGLAYYPFTCGRSGLTMNRKYDLAYLDNSAKLKGRTRLSGFVFPWEDGLNVENINIKIIGHRKTYEVKTDDFGFFEIYDLPAGDYLIEPAIPFGWKLDESTLARSPGVDRDTVQQRKSKNRVPITLKEKRHAEVSLRIDIDNSFRGRVISPDGKPMKGVRVTAVPSDQPEYDYPGRSGLTNEMGEFEIGRLTPGQYVLVANADGKIDRDEPFGTVFYPGVPDRKQASVVSIEPGTVLNDLDIQIPAFAEMVTISGQLLFADKIPIAGGGVQFRTKDRKQFYDSRMVTDSEGRFRISIPKGVAGELVSKMWASIDESQNCPELGKLPGEEKAREIETNSVNVQGDTDTQDIKLILPFPHCQKE